VHCNKNTTCTNTVYFSDTHTHTAQNAYGRTSQYLTAYLNKKGNIRTALYWSLITKSLPQKSITCFCGCAGACACACARVAFFIQHAKCMRYIFTHGLLVSTIFFGMTGISKKKKLQTTFFKRLHSVLTEKMTCHITWCVTQKMVTLFLTGRCCNSEDGNPLLYCTVL
jgi:hypothetical protein